MIFVYKLCNFESLKKSHYNEHLLTKKHISKERCNLQTCTNCSSVFNHASSLSRHKKTCKKSTDQQNNIPNQIVDFNKVIDMLKTNGEAVANMAKASVIGAETIMVNAKTTSKSVNMMGLQSKTLKLLHL